jgi:flagellar biosynthesis protein FliQ
MTDQQVISLALQAVMLAAKVAGPFLIVTMVIGFVISLFQSVTQIQEVTLSFVPKLLGVALVMLIGGHWMLDQIVAFTHQLMNAIPNLTH